MIPPATPPYFRRLEGMSSPEGVAKTRRGCQNMGITGGIILVTDILLLRVYATMNECQFSHDAALLATTTLLNNMLRDSSKPARALGLRASMLKLN